VIHAPKTAIAAVMPNIGMRPALGPSQVRSDALEEWVELPLVELPLVELPLVPLVPVEALPDAAGAVPVELADVEVAVLVFARAEPGGLTSKDWEEAKTWVMFEALIMFTTYPVSGFRVTFVTVKDILWTLTPWAIAKGPFKNVLLGFVTVIRTGLGSLDDAVHLMIFDAFCTQKSDGEGLVTERPNVAGATARRAVRTTGTNIFGGGRMRKW